MKKNLILGVLALLLVVVFMSGIGSALTCHGKDMGKSIEFRCSTSGAGCSATTYAHTSCYCGESKRIGCVSGSDCASGYSLRVDKGSCDCSWTCSDGGPTNEYQCSGNIRQRKYYNADTCGSSYGSCSGSGTSWVDIETCAYGCSGGKCNTCSPLTSIHYEALGLCGANLNDSCGGTIPNFENCSNGQNCTADSNCQTGICENGICVATRVNLTYWANLNGEEISSADLEDTVYMIYGGEKMEDSLINFTVQEFNSSAVLWNPFTWLSKSWSEANKISSNEAYETLKINNKDKKRFTAEVMGSSSTSSNLTINDSENSIPEIISIYPEDNSVIYVSNISEVEFRQESKDEDDLLKIVWNFGDGNKHTLENYSYYLNSSSADINYTYNKHGVYKWNLEVSEMGRNQKTGASGKIHVLSEGINVMPVINSPEEGKAYGVSFIIFNASQTYVVNCSLGELSNPDITTLDGKLKCEYIHAPDSNRDKDLNGYYLTFNWTFGEGKPNKIANWSKDDFLKSVEFLDRYPTSGVHNIELSVLFDFL